MVSVPAFLLKRLYVKGSLTATADGFEFRVENKLGSGYSVEMMPVTLDGASFPKDQTYFHHADGTLGLVQPGLGGKPVHAGNEQGPDDRRARGDACARPAQSGHGLCGARHRPAQI